MRKPLFLSILLNIVLIGILAFTVHRLGGIRHILFKIRNGGIAGTYAHRTQILDRLSVDSTDIVFLGNSITEQGEWHEFFDYLNIKNRGIAGDFTDGVLKRLPSILKGKPKTIFLMIGVNDLLFHQPPHILDNYKKIVAEIRTKSPETTLYLQSVLPVNNQVKRTGLDNADIRTINEGIEKIANATNVAYIDLYTLLQDKNENLDAKYTSDGIHLNGDAYDVWVEHLKKHLQPSSPNGNVLEIKQ